MKKHEKQEFSEEIDINIDENELDAAEPVSDYFADEKTLKHTRHKTFYEWLDSFVISLIVVVILFTFVFGKVRVEGPSMENTLQSHDHLLVSNLGLNLQHGDIIIISKNPQNFAHLSGLDHYQPTVKRIIAMGGDRIEIRDGDVYVNGELIYEDYIKDEEGNTDNKQFHGEHLVPEGRLFVMGDNRHLSHDSRDADVLFVDERYVLGRVFARIHPFNAIRIFN